MNQAKKMELAYEWYQVTKATANEDIETQLDAIQKVRDKVEEAGLSCNQVANIAWGMIVDEKEAK